ncbi:MAG TPA: efflux RND transporter periplasmic adaptor subunit [Thermoanaerobaculia bacterium]|nr:efflux RND transporter periplasmic adaptor subunit [Thermoanaerobaculia bacterium]
MEPYENNHKQRRFLIIAIMALVVVLAGVFFLKRGKDEGGEQYRSEAASRGDITATASATGTLSAVTTVQVGSQVSGIVAKLHADFNSQVQQGQLLAELDPTSFLQAVEQRQAEVTRSQIEVANAQLTYNRQRRLAASGLVAQAEVDSARAAYESARAQLSLSQASLKQAKTNLGYTKIYSPIEGQVVDRQYDIGQTVAASFQAPTLFTIAKDLTKMQVQAAIDQSDIGRIKVGDPVRFTVDAYPDQQFRGAISQVRLNATVNQNVITYPVIVEVANPDLKLRPSMTADVTIEVDEVQNVLRVPNAALRFRPETEEGQGQQQGQGQRRAGAGSGNAGSGGAGRQGRQSGQTVYVLEKSEDGKSELRPVRITTGLTDGRYTEVKSVLSGELSQGDTVVTGLATLTNPQSGTAAGGRMGPRMGRF